MLRFLYHAGKSRYAYKIFRLGTQYCADNPDVTFTYEPAGGTFNVVSGLTDNLNGTATLSPSIGPDGTRFVRYTYTDIYGCNNKLEKNVQIYPVPAVNFIGLSTAGYCKNADGSRNIALNNVPFGTFSCRG